MGLPGTRCWLELKSVGCDEAEPPPRADQIVRLHLRIDCRTLAAFGYVFCCQSVSTVVIRFPRYTHWRWLTVKLTDLTLVQLIRVSCFSLTKLCSAALPDNM